MDKRYRYESWETFVASQVPLKEYTAEQVSAAVEQMNNPDLDEFLKYQRGQLWLAQLNNLWEDSELPPDWKQFKYAVDRAASATVSGDTSEIALAFYQLGQAAGQLENEMIKEAIVPALLVQQREAKRTRKQDERNWWKSAASKTLKECAQREAVALWELDTEQLIRIGEMCELVYKKLLTATHGHELYGYLPGSPEGIKAWLRPVAPAYATKAGPPKRK
ncbi:hypothetical protein [Microbulbifer magnicolonia]|uniref:hypothetical protein n=1 Tax=Microbulbifer magnicolonia TaxID=3109744 RepID=UPI002B407CF5|nr:hypothetical protein [Microbulbifer sp. GG15]